ncbi:Monoamine oxidase [Klebsiella pneumoniae]|nr:Monoamine oxidase [Klebsiella pneumoniae]
MKEGKAWVSDTFINDVFQSGLDQTFQVEKRPHPLNSLSAAEISEAVTIVKAAPEFQPNTALLRFPYTSRIRRRYGPLPCRERRSMLPALPMW